MPNGDGAKNKKLFLTYSRMSAADGYSEVGPTHIPGKNSLREGGTGP